MKAEATPKSEDVEKITPVFMAPISLRLKRKRSMERPMLNAPTVVMYGIADRETCHSSPSA